jgi:hypothetical protein
MRRTHLKVNQTRVIRTYEFKSNKVITKNKCVETPLPLA